MQTRPTPVVLAILDGWGERSDPENNAIAQAKTPNWDSFLREFPHGRINASELHVGLPEGQMGNSEVGHTNIGAGRVVMQDLPRIDKSITDGTLVNNAHLITFIARLKKSGGVCHLMGLLSPGGVHAHQRHMAALANIIAASGIKVCVHAFLDGRDTPPRSALEYLAQFEKDTAKNKNISIATVCGRYYAMDRDKRWERVQMAYGALANSQGVKAKNPAESIDLGYNAIHSGYIAKATDEFILPSVIEGYAGMNDGDGLLMANFRSDRVREILTVLLDPAFNSFARNRTIKFAATLGMVEYSDALNPFIPALFPTESLSNILGEVVSKAGLKQLRIAETEKYAHVTFFFNGGREEVFPGEERILVPSPSVATYDQKPEMSAFEVTDKLLAALGRFDFIVVNYANADMVGHTGDLRAATKAIETVDTCLGKLASAVLEKGGALLITADHGNAEAMFDHETEQAHTAHTLNVVPSVILSNALRGQKKPLPEGRLADVAPTMLALLGLPQPAEMTGRSLLDA